MNTFELAKSTQQLPTKLDDVVKFLYVGEAGLAWGRKIIQQMKSAGIVDKEHSTLLEEAQRLGDLVLDANVRLGELLPSAEEAIKAGQKRGGGVATKDRTGIPSPLPEGVNYLKAKIARKLAANPEAVKKIKEEARRNEDIPSKTAVIKHIQFEKEKKRRIAAEGKATESRAIMKIDELQYINALDRVLVIVPQNPPKNWSDEFYNEACGKIKIIINRFRYFNKE